MWDWIWLRLLKVWPQDVTFAECNVKVGQTPLLSTIQSIEGAGQEIVIDYTDVGVRTRGKRYLLVMVDAHSGCLKHIPRRQKTRGE